MLLGVVLAAVPGFAGSGWAQQGQVEITAPAPERAMPRELVTPGQPPQVTRPHENDYRPDDVRTRHDPAFITPLTTTIRTGPKTGAKVGVSGWTSPPGRGNNLATREVAGGVFGFGFSFVWDVPLEPEQPKGPAASPILSR
jgi:hypothetical protein